MSSCLFAGAGCARFYCTLARRLARTGHGLFHSLAAGIAAVLLTAGAADAGNVPAAARVDHVVIVSIDGLRPDAISAVSTPNLSELIRQGAYAAHARTVAPIATLPSHTSMLTGLTPTRHGVRFNKYEPGHYRRETVYSVVKRAGLTTAMLFAKPKLHYLADPRYLDYVYGPPPGAGDFHRLTTAAQLAAVFAEQWPRYRFALTVVHFREPDIAGHAEGWMSEGYLAAVSQADSAVGVLVATLQASSRWPRIALIVTADHGGSGRSHWPVAPESWTIPWIAVAPGVPSGLRIERTLRIYDTAPTVLALLGLKMNAGGEGRVIDEVMGTPHGAATGSMLVACTPMWDYRTPICFR